MGEAQKCILCNGLDERVAVKLWRHGTNSDAVSPGLQQVNKLEVEDSVPLAEARVVLSQHTLCRPSFWVEEDLCEIGGLSSNHGSFHQMHSSSCQRGTVLVVEDDAHRCFALVAATVPEGHEDGSPNTAAFAAHHVESLEWLVAEVTSAQQRIDSGDLVVILDLDETLYHVGILKDLEWQVPALLKHIQAVRANVTPEFLANPEEATLKYADKLEEWAIQEKVYELMAEDLAMLEAFRETGADDGTPVVPFDGQQYPGGWEDAALDAEEEGAFNSGGPVVRIPAAGVMLSCMLPGNYDSAFLLHARPGLAQLRGRLASADADEAQNDNPTTSPGHRAYHVRICTAAHPSLAREAMRLVDHPSFGGGASSGYYMIHPKHRHTRVVSVWVDRKKGTPKVLKTVALALGLPGCTAAAHPSDPLEPALDPTDPPLAPTADTLAAPAAPMPALWTQRVVAVDDQRRAWDEESQRHLLELAPYSYVSRAKALLADSDSAADKQALACINDELGRIQEAICCLRSGVATSTKHAMDPLQEPCNISMQQIRRGEVSDAEDKLLLRLWPAANGVPELLDIHRWTPPFVPPGGYRGRPHHPSPQPEALPLHHPRKSHSQETATPAVGAAPALPPLQQTATGAKTAAAALSIPPEAAVGGGVPALNHQPAAIGEAGPHQRGPLLAQVRSPACTYQSLCACLSRTLHCYSAVNTTIASACHAAAWFILENSYFQVEQTGQGALILDGIRVGG